MCFIINANQVKENVLKTQIVYCKYFQKKQMMAYLYRFQNMLSHIIEVPSGSVNCCWNK